MGYFILEIPWISHITISVPYDSMFYDVLCPMFYDYQI